MRMYLLICMLGMAAACSVVKAGEMRDEEEFSFTMQPGGRVTLICDDGSVTVKAWDKNEVYLKVTKIVWEHDRSRAEELLRDLQVKTDHYDDDLYIKEIDLHHGNSFRLSDLFNSQTWRDHPRYRIDFDLVVPREINLKIESDEGDVQIDHVSGRLDLEIDEGNLLLSDLENVDVRIRIDEGDTECRNIRGENSRMDLFVDEGLVRFDYCEFSTLEIESDEGGMILKQLRTRDCRITSDDGDIEVGLQILRDGRYRLSTDEGDITILLAENSNISLDLTSSDGRVRSDFPLTMEEWGSGGQRLRGKVGQETARLTATTDDGHIVLRKD